MKRTYLLSVIFVVVSILALNLFAQEYSYDYEKMTMDEYKTELAKWQKCEADNKAMIADEEGQIANLNDEIASTDQQIADTWNDIYTLLGTDKAGYEDYLSKLQALQNDLTGFVALSPEDIYTRKGELDGSD